MYDTCAASSLHLAQFGSREWRSTRSGAPGTTHGRGPERAPRRLRGRWQTRGAGGRGRHSSHTSGATPLQRPLPGGRGWGGVGGGRQHPGSPPDIRCPASSTPSHESASFESSVLPQVSRAWRASGPGGPGSSASAPASPPGASAVGRRGALGSSPGSSASSAQSPPSVPRALASVRPPSSRPLPPA